MTYTLKTTRHLTILRQLSKFSLQGRQLIQITFYYYYYAENQTRSITCHPHLLMFLPFGSDQN